MGEGGLATEPHRVTKEWSAKRRGIGYAGVWALYEIFALFAALRRCVFCCGNLLILDYTGAGEMVEEGSFLDVEDGDQVGEHDEETGEFGED